MSAEKFDVIVMGGGPGGSSTATFLAQKGYRVLLLERERFPRFHIGESLLPAGWELWDKLGVLPELDAAGFTIKQGVNFRMFGAPTDLILLTAEYPQYFPRPYAFHVERAKFDSILLNNARKHGVDAREEWAAKDVLFEGDRASGVLASPNGKKTKPIYAPIVVDATGRSCLLARKLGHCRPDPGLNKISHFSHFQGPWRRLNDEGGTMTDIHTTEEGWIWYIPLSDDIVSVGVVLDARAVGPQKGPQARFDYAISRCQTIRDWLGSAKQTMEMQTISSICYLNDNFVGNGFVMVGDASMFVDPIFSAGVTLAIRGGMFAADAIDDAFETGDFSAERLAVYEQRIRRPMDRIFKMIYNWYEILQKKDADNIFFRSRKIPLLRERLIVLLSGGYDKVDLEAILQAARHQGGAEAVAEVRGQSAEDELISKENHR
jgi:halogenation protein CepH